MRAQAVVVAAAITSANTTPLALDNLAWDHVEWVSEHRPGGQERVELAVLTTRVDARGEHSQEVGVEHAPGEAPVQAAGVDARKRRAQPSVDHVARELGRIAAPEREQGLDAAKECGATELQATYAVATGSSMVKMQPLPGRLRT